jgi:phenylpyruvate tautomerase PptA (4-oxalocrotonate tautomerase family)
MPLLTITTNRLTEEADSQALIKQASAAVAAMLGKPERYVMVALNHNPQMLFAGDDSPLAYLELKSIGLPAERTSEFSRTLCDLISQQLQIPVDRIYIEFSDAQRHLWGWNGATF